MKLLAVDIGNTDIKLGVFHDEKLTLTCRTPSNRENPGQVLDALLETFAEIEHIDGAVYCSVVPELENATRTAIHRGFTSQTPVLAIVPSQIDFPIEAGQYPLHQLGPDRLVNLCAAHSLYPKTNVVVADFGTATTLDALSEAGAFLGGVITPGLLTFRKILSVKTSRLKPVLPHAPLRALGGNTEECLQAGLGYGYTGLIKELLLQLKTEMGAPRILSVATGGLAETFTRVCPEESVFDVVDPALTLKGLRILYEYNRVPIQSKK